MNVTKISEEKTRESNFELMRVIMMLFIIMHHYVVNSGLTSCYNFNDITSNMIFLQFFGCFGKIGINCFLFLTGYFMIMQKISKEKFLKIYLELKFYVILFYFIFVIFGYEPFNVRGMVKTFFVEFFWMNQDFAATYCMFYLVIPFLNVLLKNITKKMHLQLIFILIFLFTIIPILSGKDIYSSLSWMITIYCIAAYIRLYPCLIYENIIFWLVGTVVCIGVSLCSILVIDFWGTQKGFFQYYIMLDGEYKILPLICGLFIFMLFKNIKIQQSVFINNVAKTTFGVLMIHANSDIMRKFLWRDLFKNTEWYSSSFLIVHMLFTVIVIYIVCVLIDSCRILWLEKPFFNFLREINKHRYKKV